ncbi:MAG: hypothetical protein WC575_01340 [Patescibacteria group bacterium]
MNSREMSPAPELVQNTSKDKKRSWKELRDEVVKEKGIGKGFTDEEQIVIEQEIETKELLADGAKLVFSEDGSTRLEPTTKQIDNIRLEWDNFIKNIKGRYINASNEFIKKEIKDLEHGRRRNIADKANYEFSLLEQVNREQLLLATLKEILKEREEKK